MKRNTGGTKINTLTACISTTLMLILLGAVVFVVCFAHKFSDSLKENFSVTLMLDENTTQNQAYDIQTKLRKLPCTRAVHYISKERALKEQSEALGTDPTEFLGVNPLPASFEMDLKAEYANSDSLSKILPPLRSDSLIMDVTAPHNLMDSLNDNIRRISLVLLVVALLLTLVSFVLINNTILLSIYARRFTIKTMRMVGASYSFIRKPFLQKAVVIGLVAALLATLFLGGVVYYFFMQEPEMMALITWDVVAITTGTIFLCGILFTMTCTLISVNQFLNMKNRRFYSI